jgi:hypothetical protein
MLSIPVDQFDLGFFTMMLDHGAKICTKGPNNALTEIILHGSHYIDTQTQEQHSKNQAIQNIVDLINLITSRGVEPPDDILEQVILNDRPNDVMKMIFKTRKPDNSQTIENTLTRMAVHCLKNNSDTRIIQIILLNGGISDSSNTKTNTMTVILKELIHMIRRSPFYDRPLITTKAKHIIEQIHKSGSGSTAGNHNQWSKPNESDDENGTLYVAITLKNIELIELISGYQESPIGPRTLIHGIICTDNSEIVKILCSHRAGVEVNRHVGLVAVQSLNPEILHEIIVQIGKYCITYEKYEYVDLFADVHRTMKPFNEIKFLKLVNLLLCMGYVPKDRYIVGMNYLSTHMDLLNHKKNSKTERLKHQLAELMSELRKDDYPEQQFLTEFDHGTNLGFPVACIQIIHGYVHKESSLPFIDWSKY